LEKGL